MAGKLLVQPQHPLTETKPMASGPSDFLLWPLLAFGFFGGLYAGALTGMKWVWFSYHPSAMMLAYVGLSSAAAIVKKRGGYANTKLHGILMTVATCLALFGWYVMYSNKEASQKPHLTSWHSLVGMVAIVGFVGLDVVGMLALHPDFGVLRTNKTVRTAHKYGGRVVMATGYAACVMGFNKMNPNQIHQAAFGAPLAIAALVLLR